MSEEKLNPIKQELENRKKAKAELEAKRKELAANVDKSFTDGEREGKIVEFVPDKELRGKVADAYSVNFGNPNAHYFIHCEQFLTQFKGKE